MRKILSTALALVAIVFMAACSEEDFTSFDGKKSGIYIQRTTTSTPVEFLPAGIKQSSPVNT